MKAKLEFNFNKDGDREGFEDAYNGTKYKLALKEVWEKCFRPLYKHGYGSDKIKENNTEVFESIDAIAEIYNKITEDMDI